MSASRAFKRLVCRPCCFHLQPLCRGRIMRIGLVLAALFFAFHSSVRAQDEARLLRFPAIHDQSIVFTYAGDLYSVPAAGGVARKLTSHVGFEMFARFSPD